MSARSRRPLSNVLRMMALVLFVLGVLMQPGVATIGELHEVDPEGQHALVDQSESLPESEEGSGADTLHALHHLAHCCGHQVAMVGGAMKLFESPMDSAAPSNYQIHPHPDSRVLAPFRPPITA